MNDPASKKDLADMGKKIVEDIGNQIQDAMTLIGQRMDGHDERLDRVEGTVNRIENQMNPTIEHLDDVEARVSRLEKKAAQLKSLGKFSYSSCLQEQACRPVIGIAGRQEYRHE